MRYPDIKTPEIVENIGNCLNHILAGFKKYVCQTPWYMLLYCKQSCKARFKNDKDLG